MQSFKLENNGLNYMQGWTRSEFPPNICPADARNTDRILTLPDLTYSWCYRSGFYQHF